MVTQQRSRNHQLYVCVFILAFMTTSILVLLMMDPPVVPDRRKSNKLVQLKLEESLEETGCKLPELDPYSEEAMRFNKDMPKVVCEGKDWVECYNAECKVTKEILDKFENIVCIYKDIIYIDDHNYRIGDPHKVYGDGVYKLNISDHVKISCLGRDKNSRFNLISTRWYGLKAGIRPVPRVPPPGREKSVNILILAFDSTSRNGFLRRMPKSYRALEDLGAVILKGFNIVGDGTPATLFPLLSGRTELEHPDSSKRYAKNKHLDPASFIFHSLEKDGYHTAYLEDMPWIGSFQYRYNGFSGRPADHYLRPFFLEENKHGVKWWSGKKGRYCVGAMPQYMLMLNLTRQFMVTEGKRFCFTFIADITHDDFNMITTADDDLVTFLHELKQSELLEDTLLIVMSDHGTRFSPIRETYQGKIEERLPLLSIILPEILKRDRPSVVSALKNNAEVLTTPFDLHTTILDAMGLKYLTNKYSIPGSGLARGLSLLDAIPKSRSCGQAGVLRHWCACTKWYNVSVVDRMYNRVAEHLAGFINNITEEKRHLTSIEVVLRESSNEEVLRFRRGMDGEGYYAHFVTTTRVAPHDEYYQAKIVMSPGRAVYEGSMKYDLRKDKLAMSERDISRITAYSDEPTCVSDTHPHLNKYCYCISQIHSTIYSV